jgi:hypothetical protein
MAKMEAIDLIINTAESAKSLKDVKSSLKEINNAMFEAGKGTKEFDKLGEASKKLKDKINDTNKAIQATSGNKFEAVASFAASASGAITAVSGAMGILGINSENAQKSLVAVQSAMAFSQGLQQLSELPKAFVALQSALGLTTAVQQTKNIVDAEGVVVTEAQVVATAELEVVQKRQSIGTKIATGLQWLWNTAIMANPIGAIVIAVAALVAGIYLLTKAFSSSNVEQERQIKLTKQMNEASVEGAKNSAVERNNLEILYKTSTDQTKSLQERKDAQVELQKTYPLTFQNYTDEEFALGKAKIGFDNLTDSVLAVAIAKAKQGTLDKMAIEKEEFMVTKTAELTQAISDQTNARTTWGKVAGYTREENIREEIAAKEIEFDLNTKAIVAEIEAAKAKSKLSEEEKVAAAQTAKDKADDEAKAKSDAEKNAAAYKARKEQEAKINEDFRVSELTAEQKSFEDFRNAQKVFLDNKNITKEEFESRLKKRQDEIDAKKLEAAKKNEDEFLKIVEDASEELLESDKKYRKEKFDNLLIDQEKIITDSATTLEQKLAALDIENNAIIASTDILLEDKIIKLEENEKRQVEITKKANLDKLNSGLDLAKQGLASIQAVTDVAFEAKLKKVKKGSKEEEKLMRQQFKLNKAMQLAGAIVDGTKAALTSLASAPVAIGVVPNPVGIAALAFTVATSLANIAKIAATQFDTTSVGGGENNTPDLSSGGNMDAINTSPNGIQPSTQLDENGNVISNQNNNQQPIQAYMVESQATSVQNNVAMIESSMTFHAPALNPV